MQTWGFLLLINKASYEQEERARSLKYISFKELHKASPLGDCATEG